MVWGSVCINAYLLPVSQRDIQLSQVLKDGVNTPKAAQLCKTFAIPNRPKNLKDALDDWAQYVLVWIKLAVNFGITLN